MNENLKLRKFIVETIRKYINENNSNEIIAYHGTRYDFIKFEPFKPSGAIGNKKGIYFTRDLQTAIEYAENVDGALDNKSRVIKVKLIINSPKDGQIINHKYRGEEIIIFDPNKIKILNNNVLNNNITENTYKVFHGTNNQFNNFDYDKIGKNTESAWNGMGFYFSDNQTEASLYGNKIINAEINLNNPIDLTTINDTSVQGSGLIKFFSKIKGFQNVKHDDKTILEISKIINDLENNFKYSNISFSEGLNQHFKHVWYEYDGKEYVNRNKTQNEINNKEWLKSIIISNILYNKYNISGLPIRVSELMNPYSFTKIAMENGYDGVIAPNSTTTSGNEYVVFNKNNIKIIN